MFVLMLHKGTSEHPWWHVRVLGTTDTTLFLLHIYFQLYQKKI